MAPQTKTIDGLAITCASLEPADAYDLMPELAPILGAALAAKGAVKPSTEGKVNEDGTPALVIDMDDVGALLAKAGKELGMGKMTDLLVKLLRATIVVVPSEAGPVQHRIADRGTLNLAFSGRMWSVFAVAAFAFEVTFGNFTDVVARLPGVTRTP